MAAQTAETKTDLTYWMWLTFDRDGSAKMTRNEPGIARDERKMRLAVTLPKSLFTSPALIGSIVVTDDNHEPKIEINIEAAQEALRGALGVDVKLTIETPPSDSADPFE